MPKANGKHFPYTKKICGRNFRSSGKTFNRLDAGINARKVRKRGSNARVVRLGKSDRYAIYSNTPVRRLSKGK